MKNTEYGLMISIKELKQLMEDAELLSKYNNMESRIYIKSGEHFSITQYSNYAECNSADLAKMVQEETR